MRCWLALITIGFTGCTMGTHVRVLTSPKEITVKHLQVEDGDTIVCDPLGCRVLPK